MGASTVDSARALNYLNAAPGAHLGQLSARNSSYSGAPLDRVSDRGGGGHLLS